MRISSLVGALLLVSVRAHAEQTFPGGIRDAADIPCTPTCVLCHTAIPGTRANLKQPFGIAVLTHGVVPGHPESMHDVVAQLRADGVDSDRDGKLDVDELAAGTNPNKADPNAEICGPVFGCGAHIAVRAPAPRAPVIDWLVTLLALSGLVVVRRLHSADSNRFSVERTVKFWTSSE